MERRILGFVGTFLLTAGYASVALDLAGLTIITTDMLALVLLLIGTLVIHFWVSQGHLYSRLFSPKESGNLLSAKLRHSISILSLVVVILLSPSLSTADIPEGLAGNGDVVITQPVTFNETFCPAQNGLCMGENRDDPASTFGYCIVGIYSSVEEAEAARDADVPIICDDHRYDPIHNYRPNQDLISFPPFRWRIYVNGYVSGRSYMVMNTDYAEYYEPLLNDADGDGKKDHKDNYANDQDIGFDLGAAQARVEPVECPKCLVSNPVSVINGNNYETQEDIRFPSISGTGFAFQRYYNSQSSLSGPFGSGWTHSYWVSLARYVRFEQNVYMKITDETGRGVYFTDSGNGLFQGAFTEKTSVQQVGQEYIWQREDNRSYVFNSEGRLLRIEDVSGNRIELTYNADSRLESVLDTATARNSDVSLQHRRPDLPCDRARDHRRTRRQVGYL